MHLQSCRARHVARAPGDEVACGNVIVTKPGNLSVENDGSGEALGSSSSQAFEIASQFLQRLWRRRPIARSLATAQPIIGRQRLSPPRISRGLTPGGGVWAVASLTWLVGLSRRYGERGSSTTRWAPCRAPGCRAYRGTARPRQRHSTPSYYSSYGILGIQVTWIAA